MSPNPRTAPPARKPKGRATPAIADIREEMQAISCDISGNFVVEPSLVTIRRDVLIAIKRFQKSVRNRYRQVMKARNVEEEEMQMNDPSDAGLGTELRPGPGSGYDNTPPSSREVEGFLHELETILLNEINRKNLKKTIGPSAKNKAESDKFSVN